MRYFTRKKIDGFTTVEVIVAAMIFGLLAAGVMATMNSMTDPMEETKEEVTAALLGKQILDDLRAEVDAENWNDPATSLLHPAGGPGGDGIYNPGAVILNGITYTPTYTVTADPGGSGARRVTITVNW